MEKTVRISTLWIRKKNILKSLTCVCFTSPGLHNHRHFETPSNLLTQEHTGEQISDNSQLPCTSTVRPLLDSCIWSAISICCINKCLWLRELELWRQLGSQSAPIAQLGMSFCSPWPSYHFLHGGSCSVRGSGNAFVQSPSCGHARRAQSRWWSFDGYGFSSSGTSAL